ncbi:hypothetical protein JW835_07525 [bacterium]|nr:hypothetical protein [bacterium]
MSRKAIKIETGIFGLALILTVILFGFGRAGNSNHKDNVQYYGGEVSSRIVGILNEMYSEIQNASTLHIAEPNHLIFENRQGDVFEYSYAYQAIWHNNKPMIMNIHAFHFEYRDYTGHALSTSHSDLLDIRTVMFVLRLQNEQKNILANGRIHIQQCCYSFHDSSEPEVLLVNAN